jgi:deoxyribodipyrimidine photo-lyase
MSNPIIYWFRQDLRTADLPGLLAAAATERPLIACYIHDEKTPGEWAPGGASRWWLHYSLQALAGELEALGGQLLIRRGDALTELPALAHHVAAEGIYCSRHYEPWAGPLEQALHDSLEGDGIAFRRYPGSLLFEPDQVRNQAGQPFRVFTPFWKACRRQAEPGRPLAPPGKLRWHPLPAESLSLEQLGLLPRNPDWAAHWDTLWQPGSRGAEGSLQRFLDGPLADYREGRDHPARDTTSRLSPHLHFGELSPRQLWHTLQRHCAHHPELEQQRDKFLSELGWREFSYHLLHHFPSIPEQPFKSDFEAFPWMGSDQMLRAWQEGRTGYPIVDAGMRELWQTGYMHNRVRMIAASFLTKHLLIPWQSGERWFWDTLVDADLANNACGWQWVAGSGADAAPYFRIFNPTLQGKKFDASGEYVRRWVPELANLPDKYIHQPDQAPSEALDAAAISLGKDYPLPIVEHQSAREAALAAYASLKQ